MAAFAWTLAGCAARGTVEVRPVAPELADEAVVSSAPAETVRAAFRWSMVDADARFSGDGVVHIAPSYRARLDLFGPRGEGYLTATLMDETIRLPPGARQDVHLPPPTLLWSAIGVVRPPADARLTVSYRDGDRVRLEYVREQERWRFDLDAGRLVRAELESGAGLQTVELREGSIHQIPRRAVYRDHAAFRELVLSLEEAEVLPALPSDIWTLDAR